MRAEYDRLQSRIHATYVDKLDGSIEAALRQPLDSIAETMTIDAKRKAAGEVSNGLSEIWLPFVDTYRTICIGPPPELRRIFDELHGLGLVACDGYPDGVPGD